jgi:acid stress-induced BolA-like protein IbaG/YrbA
MKKWVWLLVGSWCIQGSTFAQVSTSFDGSEGNVVVGQTIDGVPIVERPRVVYADSSEAYRQNHHHQLSLGIGLLVGSVTYGYLVRPDWIVEGYLQKQLEFIEGDSISATMGMKFLPGDSFYIKSAVATRKSRSPHFDNTSNQQTMERHQEEGLDLSVGNQWSWSHLILNAEWVGFYIPLFEKSKGDGTLLQFRLMQLSVGMAW